MAPSLNQAEVEQANSQKNSMATPPLRLPVIDISELDGPKHDQVAEDIVKAAERFGLFQVVNHDMPVEFLEEVKDSVHHFHSQPKEKKAVYFTDVTPSPRVLFAPGTVRDPVDIFIMRYFNDEEAFKYWPDLCRDVVLKYLKTSGKLGERVLRVLMSNLGVTLDESMDDAYLGEKHAFMNYYLPCPKEVTINEGSRKHTDFTTLTVLLQDQIGGLYAKLREDGDLENNYKGEWVQIEPIPGALILLVGDCLEMISNGIYKGGEHHVRTSAGRPTRVSFPIFMYPRSETKLEPLSQVLEKDGVKPEYKEITFGQYTDYIYSLKTDVGEVKPIDHVRISSS